MRLNPYLMYGGNCEAAFRFYAELLGGTIEAMIPHAGTPAAEHVPADWQDRIIHACIRLGEQRLMASDSPPEHYEAMQGFYVSLHPTDVAEAERLFQALSEGGKVHMPLQPTFWAARFAMLVDRFGTPWMINCEAAE